MEEAPRHHHKLFESNNGSIYSEMKMIGENNVPLGCYYDPADRYEAFKKRLADSIFVALELVEMELKRKFKIGTNDIIYEACVSGHWTKNIKLKQVNELVDQYLIKYGDEDFTLQLIVNCKNQVNSDDVQIWGTIIDINYWRDEWYDKLTDENYPVWQISIEGTTTTIDDPYTIEEFEIIRTSIINQAKKDFNEYYGVRPEYSKNDGFKSSLE